MRESEIVETVQKCMCINTCGLKKKMYVDNVRLQKSGKSQKKLLKCIKHLLVYFFLIITLFFSFRVDFNVPMKDKHITNNQR